jgi:hypothetical protein
VPQGSQLRDATRLPVPAAATWDKAGDPGVVNVQSAPEGPWLSLEALTLLPPATTLTRFFTLTLPVGVVQEQDGAALYTLRLVKQPGAAPYPVTLRVRLPAGAVLLDATHKPAHTAGDGWQAYRLTLDRDLVFHLRWRTAP